MNPVQETPLLACGRLLSAVTCLAAAAPSCLALRAWARMISERELLRRAEALAAGLIPPYAPTACPECVVLFSRHVEDEDPSRLILKTKCHAFFDSILGFISAGWTSEQRVLVSHRLDRTHLLCRQCNPRGKTLEEKGNTEPAFNFACRGICSALAASLQDRMGRHDKGFASKRGRWPVTPKQLFPGGPERTLDGLVGLLRARVCVEPVIIHLVTAHRPLAFPVLLQPENRGRIIAEVIARANDVSSSIRSDIAKLRPPVIPAVREAIGRRHLEPHEPCIFLLYIFGFGADCMPNDKVDFMSPHETDIFAALHDLLGCLESPNDAHEPLAYVAAYLWSVLPKSRRAALGCQEMPAYARAIDEQSTLMRADPYLSLRHFLALRVERRDCHGPDCKKQVHDKQTPGAFSRCGKCRTVQYCSRDCQRADWTDVAFPHKAICDMLQELLAFTTFAVDDDVFADACRAHSFPLERVDRLIEWATRGETWSRYAQGGDVVQKPGPELYALIDKLATSSEVQQDVAKLMSSIGIQYPASPAA
ncbi:hypothetical protein AURDEDRAFT_130602 [Auricularia subglabra TFB-10046 SS5]|uniref:MYND-type domain-containing protein n=1 Tax=Auricularia subglabra (strain TFB-10046 / SS5) TaxID=717982 RepID=J0WTD2_AURST|nr:hypothetical protein AURDEDRAFT_130602 [Auricularia subglabra TFB-10046 SS5]